MRQGGQHNYGDARCGGTLLRALVVWCGTAILLPGMMPSLQRYARSRGQGWCAASARAAPFHSCKYAGCTHGDLNPRSFQNQPSGVRVSVNSTRIASKGNDTWFLSVHHYIEFFQLVRRILCRVFSSLVPQSDFCYQQFTAARSPILADPGPPRAAGHATAPLHRVMQVRPGEPKRRREPAEHTRTE
jgi:hypothetical protein